MDVSSSASPGTKAAAAHHVQHPRSSPFGPALDPVSVIPKIKSYFLQLSNTFLLLLFSSDPCMGLGPGSPPGASPLSCANSRPDPAQNGAGSARLVPSPFYFCLFFRKYPIVAKIISLKL
jgi:hypothetical protein